MTNEEKKKYIKELFKYCSTDSILIINHIGHLERLYCPFYALVIVDVHTLKKTQIKQPFKNDLFTINAVDKNNKFNPIIHKCDPERIGEPMTDDELHTFAIDVVLVFYHHQHGYIKSKNTNPGIEYPHIVMENKDTSKLYYVIVKAGIHPHVPKPLPTEDYSTLIKLAEEANAYPVFICVVFSKYSKDDDSSFKCGDEYLVRISRLKEL